MTQQNAINWFEIPTADFERAVTFMKHCWQPHYDVKTVAV